MTDSQLLQWKKLYLLSAAIADFHPWDHFEEDAPFVCILDKTALFFSFLQKSSGQPGIACYRGELNYSAARRRLAGPNPKKEPVFFLQTALIGLWGNREEVSTPNRQVIKDMGLKCRGKGTWLHFDSYLPGRFPAPLSPEELDLLCEGFSSLFLMVKAVLADGYAVDFSQGEMLLRSDGQIFRADRQDLPLAQRPPYSTFLVREDEVTKQLRDTPTRMYSMEVDWSYMNHPMREGRKKFYPRFLLMVDSASAYIHWAKLINPYEDHCAFLLNSLGSVIEEYGKPKKIYLCDPELEACLKDFCEKIDLPIVIRKNLLQANWARKTFLEKLFGQS